jgi:hypothetical protein
LDESHSVYAGEHTTHLFLLFRRTLTTSKAMTLNQPTSQTDLTLLERLAALEARVEQLLQANSVADRVTQIETKLLLVADLYRYGKLQELLAAGNFEQADRETVQIILLISSQPDLESITPNDVRHFSCHELRVIDTLWTTYSQNHFGFSVQAELYQTVGGSLNTTIAQDDRVIVELGKVVGWRKNNAWQKCDELDYSLNAPRGCHPSRWWNSPFGAKMTNYFFARLITCEL